MMVSDLLSAKGMEDNIIGGTFSNAWPCSIHVEFLDVTDRNMIRLIHLRMKPTSLFCSSYKRSVAPNLSTSRIFWSTGSSTVYVLYVRLHINVQGWLLCLAHGIMHFLSVFNIKATLLYAPVYLCLHLDIRICLRMHWFSATRRMNFIPALTVPSFKAFAISASTHLWVNSFTTSRSSACSLK